MVYTLMKNNKELPGVSVKMTVIRFTITLINVRRVVEGVLNRRRAFEERKVDCKVDFLWSSTGRPGFDVFNY